jgi:outer membrane protein TolC
MFKKKFDKIFLFLIYWLLILFDLLITCFASNAQERSYSFSLKDCINYTIANNINKEIYQNDSRAAEEKIKQSKAAFLPTVSASANVDYNIKLQTSIIPAGTFSATETKLQMGNKVNSGAYIQADQTIFDQSSFLSIISSKLNKDISDLNLKQEVEALMYNTATSYCNVLTYKEKNKLLQIRKEQYQQLLSIAELRYEQGVQKKSEFDKASVSLNNAIAEIELNEQNYQLSINKLKYAMGMSWQSVLVINDSLENLRNTINIDLSSITEIDTTNYTAYLIDKKNTEIKQLEIEKKRSAFLPTVSVYGKYGGNSYGSQFTNTFNSIYDYSSLGLKINVPIYSGLKKSSELKQSKIEAKNQALTQKLNITTYNLNVKNEQVKLYSSYTSVIKNKQNLDLAKEVIKASLLDYQTGNGNLSNFLNDDYAYKEAQNNYITSLIDFLNSQLSYEKAKGTLISYLNNIK